MENCFFRRSLCQEGCGGIYAPNVSPSRALMEEPDFRPGGRSGMVVWLVLENRLSDSFLIPDCQLN